MKLLLRNFLPVSLTARLFFFFFFFVYLFHSHPIADLCDSAWVFVVV